ncbi:MAG: glycosyltransferase family 4 protein [Bacillota bacterium]|nr:glycosyltransferase family 4 protein [Bacillota bacterium]
MRILLLANNDVGLYRFRYELVQALRREHEVFLSLPFGEFVKDFEKIGCSYVRTEFNRRGLNPLSDIILFFRYLAIMRKVKPDIVLTYTAKPNIYGGMACCLFSLPCIANITGLGTVIEKKNVLSAFLKLLYRFGLYGANCIFFQNRYNMEAMRGVFRKNAHVRLIPGSGVNVKRFFVLPYPPDDGPVKFLFIGRIMRDKGIEEFLDAFSMLQAEGIDVRADILGDFDEESEATMNVINNNGSIHYHGFQEDIQAFIAAAHCLVLPSYHEGTANVLLEAAASGRPVIATRVPGCQETFDEGVSGFGCEVRDAQSLAVAMRKFVQLSREEKREMGLAGRAKMEREFDRDIVVNAYLDEMNRILSARTE